MASLASTVLQTFKVYVKVGFAARGFSASVLFCLFVWILRYMSTPQTYVFICNCIEIRDKQNIKICTKADMVYNYIARSRMIGNLTFSIRIHCFSWIYIFHFLFGKLARHSLNSLYVKKHEYFVLCSFQTSYASLHIVKSNTYRVPLKSTVRPKLFVILNFRAKLFHIFS